MRILMADDDPARRARLEARLRSVRGVTVTNVAADLTETYHVTEHRPTGIAVIAESLARLPEFEVLLLLFRAVMTRVVVVVRSTDSMPGLPAPLRSDEIRLIAETAPEQDWYDAIFARSFQPVTARSAAPPTLCFSEPRPGRVVLIGASTGGVDALISVLSTFTQTAPPALIVQHTGGGFSAGLARLLNSRTMATVVEAEDGSVIGPGTVALAPGDRCHLHADIRGGSIACRLIDGPAIGGHRPAIDALFGSAVPGARRVAAAILTGMGRDGAEGLLALRNAGARTFGQDAGTSLVYGMPKVAAEIGAVERQLPLSKIGPALLSASAERAVA
ncbi:chemotaxis protein CheB [Rhodobacterales bacterium HKCCE3408]|nr:chemotaxis protein CheB [Rhodobacterales bacterium HKCCE3408]